MAWQILSGDPRLGPLAGGPAAPAGALAGTGYAPDFSEADPAALDLTPGNPMAVNWLEALHQALPAAAARARVSQFQLGTPQPGLIHDVGYGYGGPVGGAIADLLPQPPRTGLEAGLMVGMPIAGLHYKGETFAGASHADALEKLVAKHPEASAAIDANSDLLKVGIVRDGKFKEVSRLYPQAGDVGVSAIKPQRPGT